MQKKKKVLFRSMSLVVPLPLSFLANSKSHAVHARVSHSPPNVIKMNLHYFVFFGALYCGD